MWIFLSMSILFTALTIGGIVAVSTGNDLDVYSTPKFIMEAPLQHTRRRLRSAKNRLRRRRLADESDQMRPFALQDHRTDTKHLQEILYFLNHL